MVFGHFSSMVSGGGDEAAEHKATTKDASKDCKESVKQWWLALQRQLEGDTEGKDFLNATDNKLQPYLDIMFYNYWNTEQARSDETERYITVEQSLRLFDDLTRGTDEVSIPTLKEYIKYKLAAGSAENDAVKEKKTKFVENRKKAAGDALTKQRTDDFTSKLANAAEISSGSTTALEIAIAQAKANGVDTAAAEATAKEVQETQGKKDGDKIQAPVDKAQAAVEKAGEDEKAKEKATAAHTKATEKAEEEKKKLADKKEESDKEVAAAAEEAEKEKKTFEETKKTAEEEAGEKAAEDFSEELKKAVDKAVQKMAIAHNKRMFILRAAACTAFLESTTEGCSKDEEGKTITQNDLNKIMNLSDGEKFDAFCKALGFTVDSYDEVAGEIQLPDEAGFVKEDGDKEEEEK